MSLWSAEPVADAPAKPDDIAPPYFWEHSPNLAAAALRHRDGRVLLMIASDGDEWGIYQLQCVGVAVYVANSESHWELIQVRHTKAEARDAALEMAHRLKMI